MFRLLLISLALWNFASAIPEADFNLIKEVEELTESTYKNITKEGDQSGSQSDQRSEQILNAFENIAIGKLRAVSEATKQMDFKMFEAFNNSIHAKKNERVQAFKDFRSKIINYEDRVILTEIRALGAQMKKPCIESLLNFTIYTAESILNCSVANATGIAILQHYLQYIASRNNSLADFEIEVFVYACLSTLPDDKELFKLAMIRLNECTHGALERKRDNLFKQTVEFLSEFRRISVPKVQKVSQPTRESNSMIFQHYHDFESEDKFERLEYYYNIFIDTLSDF